jgi:hypothetical protein
MTPTKKPDTDWLNDPALPHGLGMSILVWRIWVGPFLGAILGTVFTVFIFILVLGSMAFCAAAIGDH